MGQGESHHHSDAGRRMYYKSLQRMKDSDGNSSLRLHTPKILQRYYDQEPRTLPDQHGVPSIVVTDFSDAQRQEMREIEETESDLLTGESAFDQPLWSAQDEAVEEAITGIPKEQRRSSYITTESHAEGRELAMDTSEEETEKAGKDKEYLVRGQTRRSLQNRKRSSFKNKENSKVRKGSKKQKYSVAGKEELWQECVDEYVETYSPNGTKMSTKRKVKRQAPTPTKLESERYDAVQQVFGRSIPLPMKTTPAGVTSIRDQDESGEQQNVMAEFSTNVMTGGETEDSNVTHYNIVEVKQGQIPSYRKLDEVGHQDYRSMLTRTSVSSDVQSKNSDAGEINVFDTTETSRLIDSEEPISIQSTETRDAASESNKAHTTSMQHELHIESSGDQRYIDFDRKAESPFEYTLEASQTDDTKLSMQHSRVDENGVVLTKVQPISSSESTKEHSSSQVHTDYIIEQRYPKVTAAVGALATQVHDQWNLQDIPGGHFTETSTTIQEDKSKLNPNSGRLSVAKSDTQSEGMYIEFEEGGNTPTPFDKTQKDDLVEISESKGVVSSKYVTETRALRHEVDGNYTPSSTLTRQSKIKPDTPVSDDGTHYAVIDSELHANNSVQHQNESRNFSSVHPSEHSGYLSPAESEHAASEVSSSYRSSFNESEIHIPSDSEKSASSTPLPTFDQISPDEPLACWDEVQTPIASDIDRLEDWNSLTRQKFAKASHTTVETSSWSVQSSVKKSNVNDNFSLKMPEHRKLAAKQNEYTRQFQTKHGFPKSSVQSNTFTDEVNFPHSNQEVEFHTTTSLLGSQMNTAEEEIEFPTAEYKMKRKFAKRVVPHPTAQLDSVDSDLQFSNAIYKLTSTNTNQAAESAQANVGDHDITFHNTQIERHNAKEKASVNPRDKGSSGETVQTLSNAVINVSKDQELLSDEKQTGNEYMEFENAEYEIHNRSFEKHIDSNTQALGLADKMEIENSMIENIKPSMATSSRVVGRAADNVAVEQSRVRTEIKHSTSLKPVTTPPTGKVKVSKFSDHDHTVYKPSEIDEFVRRRQEERGVILNRKLSKSDADLLGSTNLTVSKTSYGGGEIDIDNGRSSVTDMVKTFETKSYFDKSKSRSMDELNDPVSQKGGKIHKFSYTSHVGPAEKNRRHITQVKKEYHFGSGKPSHETEVLKAYQGKGLDVNVTSAEARIKSDNLDEVDIASPKHAFVYTYSGRLTPQTSNIGKENVQHRYRVEKNLYRGIPTGKSDENTVESRVDAQKSSVGTEHVEISKHKGRSKHKKAKQGPVENKHISKHSTTESKHHGIAKEGSRNFATGHVDVSAAAKETRGQAPTTRDGLTTNTSHSYEFKSTTNMSNVPSWQKVDIQHPNRNIYKLKTSGLSAEDSIMNATETQRLETHIDSLFKDANMSAVDKAMVSTYEHDLQPHYTDTSLQQHSDHEYVELTAKEYQSSLAERAPLPKESIIEKVNTWMEGDQNTNETFTTEQVLEKRKEHLTPGKFSYKPEWVPGRPVGKESSKYTTKVTETKVFESGSPEATWQIRQQEHHMPRRGAALERHDKVKYERALNVKGVDQINANVENQSHDLKTATQSQTDTERGKSTDAKMRQKMQGTVSSVKSLDKHVYDEVAYSDVETSSVNTTAGLIADIFENIGGREAMSVPHKHRRSSTPFSIGVADVHDSSVKVESQQTGRRELVVHRKPSTSDSDQERDHKHRKPTTKSQRKRSGSRSSGSEHSRSRGPSGHTKDELHTRGSISSDSDAGFQGTQWQSKHGRKTSDHKTSPKTSETKPKEVRKSPEHKPRHKRSPESSPKQSRKPASVGGRSGLDTTKKIPKSGRSSVTSTTSSNTTESLSEGDHPDVKQTITDRKPHGFQRRPGNVQVTKEERVRYTTDPGLHNIGSNVRKTDYKYAFQKPITQARKASVEQHEPKTSSLFSSTYKYTPYTPAAALETELLRQQIEELKNASIHVDKDINTTVGDGKQPTKLHPSITKDKDISMETVAKATAVVGGKPRTIAASVHEAVFFWNAKPPEVVEETVVNEAFENKAMRETTVQEVEEVVVDKPDGPSEVSESEPETQTELEYRVESAELYRPSEPTPEPQYKIKPVMTSATTTMTDRVTTVESVTQSDTVHLQNANTMTQNVTTREAQTQADAPIEKIIVTKTISPEPVEMVRSSPDYTIKVKDGQTPVKEEVKQVKTLLEEEQEVKTHIQDYDPEEETQEIITHLEDDDDDDDLETIKMTIQTEGRHEQQHIAHVQASTTQTFDINRSYLSPEPPTTRPTSVQSFHIAYSRASSGDSGTPISSPVPPQDRKPVMHNVSLTIENPDKHSMTIPRSDRGPVAMMEVIEERHLERFNPTAKNNPPTYHTVQKHTMSAITDGKDTQRYYETSSHVDPKSIPDRTGFHPSQPGLLPMSPQGRSNPPEYRSDIPDGPHTPLSPNTPGYTVQSPTSPSSTLQYPGRQHPGNRDLPQRSMPPNSYNSLGQTVPLTPANHPISINIAPPHSHPPNSHGPYVVPTSSSRRTTTTTMMSPESIGEDMFNSLDNREFPSAGNAPWQSVPTGYTTRM